MRLIPAALLICAALCAQPRRIVSTAPSITEMLFALGLGERVVGVTEYCRYPPAALKIPKIGSFLKPNMETVLALKPDLVIVHKSAIHSRAPFVNSRLNAIEVQPESIASIYEALRTIGAAAGVSTHAERVIRQIENDLQEVREAASKYKPVSLMFVVGRTPQSLDNLIVVGRRSYLTEVMEIAGGRNVFGDAAVAYPKILHEEILRRDPSVILDMGDMADTVKVTDAHKRSVVKLWSRFPNLSAVKNGRVHAVASDHYVVPGPRVVDLTREFLRLLHGL